MHGFKEWLVQNETRIICETTEMSPLEKKQYRDARSIFRQFVFETPKLPIGTNEYNSHKVGNLFIGTPDVYIEDLNRYKERMRDYVTMHFKGEYERMKQENMAIIPSDAPNRKELEADVRKEARAAAKQKGNETLREEFYKINSLISYFRRLKPKEIVKFDFSDATGSFL